MSIGFTAGVLPHSPAIYSPLHNYSGDGAHATCNCGECLNKGDPNIATALLGGVPICVSKTFRVRRRRWKWGACNAIHFLAKPHVKKNKKN
jgi:hypothetical protein